MLKRWVQQTVEREGKRLGAIAYIFCSDAHLLSINKAYLHHSYYTDVITFDYSEGTLLAGDIFISLDTVALNAKDYGATFDNELHRVMIHGVLHLCGYADASDAERDTMRQKEDNCLAAYPTTC
ncbi:MAG: rRNA maturation RNase YbeY [Prevotellaceae bacterium]|nr:rRNA maturation RNase YbeY [Prevotellaceae bacterium]